MYMLVHFFKIKCPSLSSFIKLIIKSKTLGQGQKGNTEKLKVWLVKVQGLWLNIFYLINGYDK